MTTKLQNNVKTVQYQNWSCKIFEGFYESNLFNSDTMYYFNQNEEDMPEGKCYDIVNFEGFCVDVCKEVTNKLWDNLYQDTNIIKDIRYVGMSSPQYYNYTTDKLNLDVDVDVEALEDYCFHDKMNDFNQYLKDNFTSYDGFWSFIDNNIIDFKSEYKTRKSEGTHIDSKELQVMIEYYLLDNINLEHYQYDCCEVADYLVYQYAELIDNE